MARRATCCGVISTGCQGGRCVVSPVTCCAACQRGVEPLTSCTCYIHNIWHQYNIPNIESEGFGFSIQFSSVLCVLDYTCTTVLRISFRAACFFQFFCCTAVFRLFSDSPFSATSRWWSGVRAGCRSEMEL